jgi:zinc transporter
MVELPDTSGLICGFCFSPEGAARPLDWTKEATHLHDSAWLHFRQSDTRFQAWLSACERIPQQWRDLLLDTDSHVHLETSAQGFAGVLGDFQYESDSDTDLLGTVRIFVDQHLVITARLHALKAVDQLRIEVRNGLPVRGPMDIVLRFLEDVSDIIESHSLKQAEIVDGIEDLVLKDRFLQESEELGGVRRLLTRLRRQVDAQRHALAQLTHRPPPWMCDEDKTEIRRSIERLNAIFLDLEAIQERARLLQDEIAGRIGNATNRNLYVISLLTAIFLPITLISGIFGMNVGGLPWENQPGGFGWVIAVMILTITGSLAFMHWRRFF